jgi:hypothetical protein
VGYDVSVDNKTFLITEFVNLKIKLTQFFRCVHKNRVYVCVFIRVSAIRVYRYIYLYCIFWKKN